MKTVVSDQPLLEVLERDVLTVREAMLRAEQVRAADIAAAHPSHRRSAANLVHYLELRHHDVRDLQARLAACGLSSLGRAEAHVLATTEEVLSVLARLNGHEPPPRAAGLSIVDGHEFLVANAQALLGVPAGGRATRIMVTMPSEAAEQPDLVTRMTLGGMDIARVNCAHDDAAAWERMIRHVRAAKRPNGHRPRIAMDLAGPKLRTGPLQPGPRVVRVSPKRDRLGVVTAPASVWLEPGEGTAAPPGAIVVPVTDGGWLERRRPGDQVDLVDSRGAARHWTVVEAQAGGCLATVTETTYVRSGLALVCTVSPASDTTTVGELPEVEQAHRVDIGDHLTLMRCLDPVEPTSSGVPHRIGCTLPDVFDQAKPGERVWLDDGKIGAVIIEVRPDAMDLRITDVRPGGANLKAGKGINFPDTDLRLDALTAKDLDDLDFVARHADMVNLSFVRDPADVARLQTELARRGAAGAGIVLKIENVAAFEHLPELLLTAMRSRKLGVMIARGDLAVEVGFERLAEVQEEILWVCEAAHVPVIWATQVLDTLARRGAAAGVGLVLKIENVAAFEHLPELLLTAMRSRTLGVMIARGDLAVEVGFERLAEVQEEILWVCEAAHVPVIWATQVLDTLARTGQPSRAEITDAAMSERAECVMLNKGPHIVDAIRTLDSILARMQHHQHKKRSLLRRLLAWDQAPPR